MENQKELRQRRHREVKAKSSSGVGSSSNEPSSSKDLEVSPLVTHIAYIPDYIRKIVEESTLEEIQDAIRLTFYTNEEDEVEELDPVEIKKTETYEKYLQHILIIETFFGIPRMNETEEGNKPIDYFFHILTKEYIDHIIQTMNNYALSIFKTDNWKPLTMSEFKIFLGLLYTKVIVKIPKMDLFYKDENVFPTPILSKNMPRERFWAILQVLHFEEKPIGNLNLEYEDAVMNVKPIIDLIMYIAYLIYKTDVSKGPLKFRSEVVKELLADGPNPKTRKSTTNVSQPCLHMPARRYRGSGAGIVWRRRCQLCSQNKVRKDVSTYCPSCEDNPHLCIPKCFSEFHQYL